MSNSDASACQKRMLMPSVASSSSNIRVITPGFKRKHQGKQLKTEAATSCYGTRASTPWQRSWVCQTFSALPMARFIRSRAHLMRSFHMPVTYIPILQQKTRPFGSLWRLTGRIKAIRCVRRLGTTLRSCALKCRSFPLMF